jgi:hypothetical protein
MIKGAEMLQVLDFPPHPHREFGFVYLYDSSTLKKPVSKRDSKADFLGVDRETGLFSNFDPNPFGRSGRWI